MAKLRGPNGVEKLGEAERGVRPVENSETSSTAQEQFVEAATPAVAVSAAPDVGSVAPVALAGIDVRPTTAKTSRAKRKGDGEEEAQRLAADDDESADEQPAETSEPPADPGNSEAPADSDEAPDPDTGGGGDGTLLVIGGGVLGVGLIAAAAGGGGGGGPPANRAPVAAADSFSTNEDTALVVAAPGVLANDSDADGNSLTAVLVAGPTNGTLTFNANGSFTYTPNANYNGADSFTYKVNDGSVDGNTVTVSLTVNAVNDAPVASADNYATNEDTALVVAAAGVLANDSDVDGNPLTAALVTGPANGTLTLNANGSFTYTPNANYNGADSFTYKVNDGSVDGNTVTVSLAVNAVNDAPMAVADSYATNEDTALVVPAASGVLANDSDIEGDALTAILVTGPANGTLALNADGSFTYTPNANYTGSDSFTYRATDGTTDGNVVTVALTVNAVNDAPVAVADSYSTNEDTALVVAAAGVLANDSDVDGDALTAALVTGPAHGTLALNANGSFTYTPNANYNGADSFTYKVNDGTVDGNTVTVGLTVNAVNDAPVAVADSYATNEDTALVVAAAGVLANDSDVEGDALTAALVTGPANGTLTLNANGSFTYTPNANYNGADSFTYRANDGTTNGNTVTVSLTVNAVNDAPVAVADSYSTNEDTALVVAAAGVLANDSDVDGNPLTAALVSGPANGALTLNADGSFTYTPNANYNGADSFTYRANDGTVDGNTVTVSLTVNAVNDAPVAVADSYSTDEDTALVVAAAGVLANDSDIEGDSLTAVLVSGPANGTLTLNADGSFTYTPNANYNGADSFTYRANDGTANGNTVTVSLTVNAVNDAPVAVADSYSTDEDTALVVAAAGVLANDSDVDGNPLTAALVSGPANGALTLNADGSFTYTPNANYNGADSFTYKVNDGTVDGNTVTVSLTVNAVNDAPVAVADSYSTNEDTALVVAAAGVLANDSDVEGSALTAVLVTGPTNGSLTLNADGSFTYTPNANYNGADSFTYRANDGTVDGNTVTVSLTVNAVNDAPVAVADSYSTNEDTALVVAAAGVLANDSDVEGDALTAALVSGPANGSLTLNADGSFTYTPNANYNGADSFTYKVNDGTIDGNTVTVSLTVNAVNDAPVAVADSYLTTEDTALVIAAAAGVLANDSDVEGSALSAILVSDVTNGTLTLNADGSFTYTPNSGYIGADSFTYKVNDGTVDGNTVTVSLTVAPANIAPVAVADSYSTNEDTALVVAAAGVLANDTDADGHALTAVLVTGPTNGTLTLNADGSFTYTPNANYNGSDSFTYKANDGIADGNTVTVSLTIDPVNDAPVAVADAFSVNEDGILNVAASGVLINDTDVDGDTLTAVLVTGPANGTLTLNADGSFDYTPNANYTGADSFTYKANDGTVDGNTVTVSITVDPVNDAPVTVADSYSTNEDTALNIAATGVLANDTDIDGDALTAVLVAGPTNGTLTLNADGSFDYTPNANYNGADSFTYKANDGTADGNTVTVSLTVNPANDQPVANDDTGTASEDTALTVDAASGVLANDTDIDGDTLTVSAVTGGTVGVQFALASGALLTLNADGSYVYNPNGQFEALRPGDTATDSFSYTASDGALTDTATVTITIQGANEAPVATDDGFSMTGNTPITLTAAQLLGNDSDPDGAGLPSDVSILSVNAGANGTIVDNGNGTYTFTPTTGFNGAANFTYTVIDADGATDTATVTMTVTGLVWYVDNAYAGENGPIDGSYLKPFTSLTALNGLTGDGTTNDDVDGAGDTIFVYGNGPYFSGITLEASQTLLGDGHSLVVNGLSIGGAQRTGGADVSTNSIINNAGANGGITLSTDNTVMGLTVNGTAGGAIGIQDGNGSVGNLVIDNVSLTGSGKAVDIDQGGTLTVDLDQLSSASSTSEGIHLQGVSGTFNATTGIIQTSAGTGVLIGASGGGTASSGGSVNFTYGGDISSPGGSLVEIQDRTGGTATFSGSLTEGSIAAGTTGILIDGSAGTINFNGQTFVSAGGLGGNGVTLTNNTAAINFNATGTGLDITTASGSGLTFTGGGTLNITGAGNSVTTGTGQILNLQNGAMGTNGIAFQTLTSGTVASGNAININNLDAAGAGTFSGGAVTIGGTGGAGADGINITGSNSTFTFASATIDNTAGDGIEINGTSPNLTGPVTFTTVNLDGMGGAGVNIVGATNAVNINGGTIGSTNDPAGDGVTINGGTGAVTVGASITKTSGGNEIVDISGHSGGTITFSGALTASVGGGGIRLVNNSGGNIDFTGNTTINTGSLTGINFTNTGATGANVTFSEGSLDLDTTSGTGLNATSTTTGAGSLTISGATGVGNIITSTTGRAINIDGVTSNITLNEVNVTGGGTTTGVFLRNTGAGGQFVVTGDGSTAGSGGTIANIGGADVGNITGAAATGSGMYLSNVSNVSLSNMTFSGTFTNFGIRGDNVTNFTLRDSSLTGTYGGNNSFDEGTIRFGSQNGADGGSGTTGIRGTALFEGNTISGGNEDNLAVYVYGSDTLNIAVRDNATSGDQAVFGLNNTTNGNDGFFLESGGTSNVTVNVTGVEFQGARGDMLQVVATGSTTQTIVVQNNTFHNAHTNIITGGGGIAITGSGTNYNVDYLVDGNSFKGQRASAIFSSYGGVSGTISGLVTNNTQGTANGVYDTTQANRGSMEGMFFFGGIDAKTNTAGNINYALRIDGNTIRDVNGAAGILLRSNQQGTSGQARLEATIANNTMAEFGPSPAAGVYLQPGGADLNNDKGTIGLNMSNNNINFSVGGTLGDAVFFDQASVPATFYMPGYTGAPSADGNTLAAFLTGAKGNVFTNAAVSGTGGVAANTTAVQNQAFVLTVPTALAPGFVVGWEEGATMAAASTITLADLGVLVEAAIQRWSDAGATAAQIEAMRAVHFDVVDLDGVQVGTGRPGLIEIDLDGAGYGWFVDLTPGDDTEFVNGIATADGGAAGKLDALTVVMHELGHQIGLDDSYISAGEDSLMHGYMAPGERHVPTAAEVQAATANLVSVSGDLEAFNLHAGDLPLARARASDLAISGAPDWAGLASALDFGAGMKLDNLLFHAERKGWDMPTFDDFGAGALQLDAALDSRNIFGESDYRVL